MLSRTGLLTFDFAPRNAHGVVRSVALVDDQACQLHKRERLSRVRGAIDLAVIKWSRD